VATRDEPGSKWYVDVTSDTNDAHDPENKIRMVAEGGSLKEALMNLADKIASELLWADGLAERCAPNDDVSVRRYTLEPYGVDDPTQHLTKLRGENLIDRPRLAPCRVSAVQRAEWVLKPPSSLSNSLPSCCWSAIA